MLKQEGYDLIGAAFEVFHTLGGGMAEEIYQQALEYELSLRNIAFDSKRELKVFYKNKQLDKIYIPDLFVASGIMVELKSCKELISNHQAQLFNYMRITKIKVGYLLNFGNTKELEWQRYIL
jgi:GxxExxY protein